MNWTRGTIQTYTETGAVPETGWVCGPLGLHESRGDWAVTHLRTGAWICEIEAKLPAAKKLAAELIAITEWDFGRFGTTKPPKRARDGMKHVAAFIDAEPRMWRWARL